MLIRDPCRERLCKGRTCHSQRCREICSLYIPCDPSLLMHGYQARRSLDLPVLTVFFHIAHVDITDLALAVDIILIDIPRTAASEPARRTVLASAAAVKGSLYDRFSFFPGSVFDKDRLHKMSPLLSFGRHLRIDKIFIGSHCLQRHLKELVKFPAQLLCTALDNFS